MIDRTETFFSPPNEIVPAQLPGDVSRLVDQLCARLERNNQRTLLPAKVSGTTRWYALGPSHRDGRLLREEVQCWLSRPLITNRVDVSRTSSDVMDQAAIGLVPTGSVLRVDVAHGWVDRALQNVESLTNVWSIEPDRVVDQPRPVGRVLRQFYESLIGYDRKQADAALDELRGRALLSATNLRFLRVELLSSLGAPQDLRDDPLLQGISLLSRPPAVTESLAEAADALLITPILDLGASSELRSIAERLDDGWPDLVTQTHQVTTSATARCYALGQLLVDQPQGHQLRQLAVRYPGDPIIGGVLKAISVEPPPTPPSVTPLSLYYDGEYEATLHLVASTEQPNRSGAAIALAAAVNLRDSAAAVRALAVVDRLSEPDRRELLESAVERNFFELLRAMTFESRVPTDWLDWLNGEWSDRPDLLAEWSRGWSRTTHHLATTGSDLAEALIDSLNDARRPRVRNGIPVFVDWLIGGGIPPSAVALSTTIFDILLSSEPGRTERQAALSLLEEVLAVGCNASEYREVIEAVTRELEVIGARDGWWLAQTVDLLSAYACPDTGLRTNMVAHASGLAQAWADRLDSNDAVLLDLVLRDAGATDALPPPLAPNHHAARPFNSVGLYSLLERATRVVEGWIKQRWPGVQVKASSGKVNSTSLSSLVKGVDVMLVQTSHAKHAATEAITVAAEDPSRLVLVHGRGATALMRALLDWVENEAD